MNKALVYVPVMCVWSLQVDWKIFIFPFRCLVNHSSVKAVRGNKVLFNYEYFIDCRKFSWEPDGLKVVTQEYILILIRSYNCPEVKQYVSRY